MQTYAQFFQVLFLSVFLGLLYLRISPNQSGVQSRLGALFFIIVNLAFMGMGSLHLFIAERLNFARERAAGAYSTLSYFLAKSLSEFPLLFIYPLIFGSIVYWMMHLNEEFTRFVFFCLILIFDSLLSNSYILMIGAIVPNPQIAMILAPVSYVIFMLFGGFFAQLSEIPVFLSWMQWISFFKYQYEVLIINEFKGANFTCVVNSTYCPYPNGEVVIKSLNMNVDNLTRDILVLIGMIVYCLYYKILTL